MRTNRPKLSVPFESIDIVIELASIAVLLLMWGHLIFEYSALPETVASHFNAKGEPDGYSNKGFLWFLPGLASVLYIGLFILNRYPHMHNYTVNITKENALEQYRFSTRILRIVNFLCALMFAYISYKIVQGGKYQQSSLGNGFIIVVIVTSIALPVIILLYQNKMNKNSK